jgi:transporter family-2 protein
MSTFIMILAVGLSAGAAIGLQGPMASLISQQLGVLESVFIVHLGAMVLVGVPLIFRGGGQLPNWRSLPIYTLGAGVFGLVVIAAMSYMIPRVGVVSSFIVLVLGQVLIASIRPLDLTRIAGLLLALLGVWLVVR